MSDNGELDRVRMVLDYMPAELYDDLPEAERDVLASLDERLDRTVAVRTTERVRVVVESSAEEEERVRTLLREEPEPDIEEHVVLAPMEEPAPAEPRSMEMNLDEPDEAPPLERVEPSPIHGAHDWPDPDAGPDEQYGAGQPDPWPGPEPGPEPWPDEPDEPGPDEETAGDEWVEEWPDRPADPTEDWSEEPLDAGPSKEWPEPTGPSGPSETGGGLGGFAEVDEGEAGAAGEAAPEPQAGRGQGRVQARAEDVAEAETITKTFPPGTPREEIERWAREHGYRIRRVERQQRED